MLVPSFLQGTLHIFYTTNDEQVRFGVKELLICHYSSSISSSALHLCIKGSHRVQNGTTSSVVPLHLYSNDYRRD